MVVVDCLFLVVVAGVDSSSGNVLSDVLLLFWLVVFVVLLFVLLAL